MFDKHLIRSIASDTVSVSIFSLNFSIFDDCTCVILIISRTFALPSLDAPSRFSFGIPKEGGGMSIQDT